MCGSMRVWWGCIVVPPHCGMKVSEKMHVAHLLVWLYKVYVRSIFEYGSVCFLHCPDALLGYLQKIQNKAIRICLRLPRYVSISLLHKAACLPTIKDRLQDLASRMVRKMTASNPLIGEIIRKKEAWNRQKIITQSQNPNRSHRSPLDVILSVQWPFHSST